MHPKSSAMFAVFLYPIEIWDLPVLKIGNRMVVPKEKFIHWVEDNTAGGAAP